MSKTATYSLIANTTISGSSTTSYTFSSIPSTFTDLVMVIGSGGASGDVQPAFRFNSDSGANYSATVLSGSGTSVIGTGSGSATNIQFGYFDYLSNGTNNYTGIINVLDYSNTTTYKTALARSNNASTGVGAIVGLWQNTAAITSITVLISYGASSFRAGTTFKLYGIQAGNA